MDNEFLDQLNTHFPKDRIITDSELLKSYSEDYTQYEGSNPDLLIKINNDEDLKIVLPLANKYKIPVIPIVANTNLGGLSLPKNGGIIIDLKNMNRIHYVDENNLYAVIEPGVTFGELNDLLNNNYPNLRFGYPLSPPETSIVANCLLDGLGNLSFRYGSMSEWINGLEVILPDGNLLKTGSHAFNEHYYSRPPFPDLTGMFVNFHGTTGIISKMAIQLWQKFPYRKRYFILFYDIETTFKFMTTITNTLLWDDVAGISWPLGKMIFGESFPLYQDPNEPIMYCYVDFSGYSSEELDYKDKTLKNIISTFKNSGSQIEEPFDIDVVIKMNPDFSKLSDLPARLDFLLDHPGKGLTWIGTYGPTSNWKEGTLRCFKIMEEEGFPPIVVTRPMKGGHFGVLRFISTFDKQNIEQVQRLKRMHEKMLDVILDLGYIPYKTPRWIVEKLSKNINPAFKYYVSEIKKLFDPNHILNQGNWDL